MKNHRINLIPTIKSFLSKNYRDFEIAIFNGMPLYEIESVINGCKKLTSSK